METIPYKDNMEYKMVIVVRKDVDMSKGKMAAQVAHAAVSCAMKTYLSRPELYREWYDEGQRKLVMKVENLDELNKVLGNFYGRGVLVVGIQDAGRTQIEAGTLTCVGIGPDLASKIDPYTKDLKLL